MSHLVQSNQYMQYTIQLYELDDHYDTIIDSDEMDFHSFSFRKHTLRQYLKYEYVHCEKILSCLFVFIMHRIFLEYYEEAIIVLNRTQ